MTRVSGGSVVMRMLLPPLLTVVVDRSRAPKIHDSNLTWGYSMINVRDASVVPGDMQRDSNARWYACEPYC